MTAINEERLVSGMEGGLGAGRAVTNKVEKVISVDEVSKRLAEFKALADSEDKITELNKIANSIACFGNLVMALPDFNPEISKDKPVDYRLLHVTDLLNYTYNKVKQLTYSKSEYPPLVLGMPWEFQRENLSRLFTANRFFAHGAYSSEFTEIVKAGGLMSSVSRINKGHLKKDSMPRWNNFGVENSPDAAAVFFFPWDMKYVDKGVGVYNATEGDLRGETDMAIFYPVQSFQHQPGEDYKAIQVRNHGESWPPEICVTNSKSSWEKGTLTTAQDDQLLLPLKEAFLLLPEDRYDQTSNLMRECGYSEDWLKSHIYRISITREKYYLFNSNIRKKIVEEASQIDQWLNSQPKSKEETSIFQLSWDETAILSGYLNVIFSKKEVR